MFDRLIQYLWGFTSKMESNRPHFLLIHLLIHLLLLVNCLVLVQSDDAQGEIELVNWIKLSQNNWPQQDVEDSNEFLVFHSEYATTSLFGLNKTLFDDVELVSNPYLYFRYWANKDSSFRSRKDDKSVPKREIRLKGESKWFSSTETRTGDIKSDLRSITPEEWKHFSFVQQDVFTLALKDVSVKYVQKLHADKLDSSEVTAYKETPIYDNFKENDENPTIKSGVIHFNLTSATFDLTSLNAKAIKFDLVQNDKPVATVTITPDKKVVPAELMPLFSITYDATGKVFKEVKITLTKQGFIISKITYIETTETAESALSPEDFIKSHFGKLFTLDQVDKSEGKGYVQLKETQSSDPKNKDKDICYSIDKINGPSAVIEVYLTLKDAPVGIKLDTLGPKVNSKEICLFNYIFLQNLGNYMMTFVLSGTVAALRPFQLSVRMYYKNNHKYLSTPESFGYNEFQWLYYNPQAFDYSIEVDNDPNAQFLICDIVANCYPYESLDNKKFTLPEIVQKELAQSPIVRIHASEQHFLSRNLKFLNKEIQQRFNARFLHDNQKFINGQPTTTKHEFEIKFDFKSEATITVPLDFIDLRAQQLITVVKLKVNRTVDKTSTLSLIKLNYKIDSQSEAYDLPIEQLWNDGIKMQGDYLQFSTDQLFYLGESQLSSVKNASFVLKFDSQVSSPHSTVTVRFKILRNLRIIQNKYSFKDDIDKKSIQIYPKVVEDFKDASKKEILLLSNRNRMLITNWIRAGTDQKLLNRELKTSLTVTSPTNDITPENIVVYRVIVSQGYPEFVKIKHSSQFKNANQKNSVTYVDDITKDENWKSFSTKGSFRIGYIVHSGESFDAVVIVDQFDVHGTVSSDATNNCLKEATIAFSDCQYEEPSCPYGGEFNGNTCQLKRFNRLVEKQCDMSIGCSNIFDRRLPVSANYLPTVIDPANTETEYVPFQIEPNDDAKFYYLQYKRPAKFPKGDFCLSFTYKSKRSPLVVSESVNSSGIVFPVAPASNPNQDGKVCASWLTNDVDSVDGFYFEFSKSPLYDIDNHNIEFDEVATLGEIESTIKEGIYINNLDKSQFIFPTALKRVSETFERKELSNSLKLTIPLDKLKTLPANAQVDNYGAYVYTIRTKWIRIAKKGEHLKIRFTYDSATNGHKISNVKLSVNSPLKQVWHEDISAFKPNEIRVITETTFEEHYQVEITVELNQTKILELRNELNRDLILTFANFTINDPCIEKCSASCIRNYANFSATCECPPGQTGQSCEAVDYCAAQSRHGIEYCAKSNLTCKNDPQFESFVCECPGGLKWDVASLKCA